MEKNLLLYICIGCTIVSSVASLIFALAGFYVGAINSPLTSICLWGIYFLLGKLDERVKATREIIKSVEGIMVQHGQMEAQIKVLQAIIEAKETKEENENAEQ